MQVLARDEGRLCAVSPNQSLYAIVKKGLMVFVMDFIRRADELMNHAGPLHSVSVDESHTLPRHHHSHHRRHDPILYQHESLDEIHELQWSPDSSLLALLLERRRSVEIVSVYGKCCVARIDAGLAGLRAVQWHPSSRAVYWVGLLQAHVLSLMNGQMMQLPGAVKCSAQLAAMEASSAAAATVPMRKILSAAALIRFSPCRRFLLYVVARSMNSPLVAGQKNESAVPVLPPFSGRDTHNDDNADTKDWGDCGSHEVENRPRRSEWLVALSATTHEELHAFPTRHLVQSVSDVIPLRGGIALIDYVHGSLVITTYNGAHVLYQEACGVEKVTTSVSFDKLLILFKESCRVVVVSKENVVTLRRISFEADVVAALRLRELSLTNEPEPLEGSITTECSGARESLVQSRLYTTCRFGEKEFMSYDHGNTRVQWSDGQSAAQPVKGHGSISASGQMAAVSLSVAPSYVIIIDILAQSVMAVLRHREDVTGLFWSPKPSSEYWSFQQRHYLDRKSTQHPQKTLIDTPGMEEPLFLATNNHEGKMFMWLTNHAVRFVVSLPRVDKKTDIHGKHQRGEVVMDKEAARYTDGPAFQISRCILGEHAATAVLVDDVRQIAVTVAIRSTDVVG